MEILYRVSVKSYSTVSAAILVITAAAKLVTVMLSNSVRLAYIDPLVGVRTSYLLSGVAISEIIAAAVVITVPSTAIRGFACMFFGGEFLIYRIFHYLYQLPQPCPCLGALSDWIGISVKTADCVLLGAAMYLAVVGFILVRQEVQKW
jgi:hypothetical protein